MAVTADQVIVELQAKINGYMQNVNRAERRFTTAMATVDRSAKRTSASTAGSFALIAKGFLTIQAARAAISIVDASTRISNSLKVAGLEGEELKRVYDQLYDSAQRNAAPLEALTELYSRASLVQKELGVSTKELLGFTENIAVALRVSGKSAAESSGALLQLSQAIGSGIVRAEEFNSILEGALPIAQAAAAGLEEAGGSVAKLRTLVIDGKVSSEAFFRAFEAGSVILRDKVAGAELTVAQSFVRLQNVLIDAAGRFDDTTGASAAAAQGLESLAQSVEMLGQFMADNQPAIAAFIGVLEGDWLDAVRQFREDIGLADFVDGIAVSTGIVKQSAAEIAAAVHEAVNAASGVADTKAIDGLIERMVDGDISAEELQQALIDLGGTSINFGAIHEIATLIGRLRTARAEAQALASDLARPRGPQGRGGKRGASSSDSAPVQTVSLEDYEIPASSSGTKKGGGGTKTTPESRFGDALQRVRDMTAATERESAALNLNTYAREKARIAAELMNDARDAGIKITPEVVSSIETTAEAYARATEAAEAMADEQQRQIDGIRQLQGIATGVLSGFINDLREGKSAAEALSNVFDSLAQQLINIAVQNLVGAAFGGLFGGMGGGGLTGIGQIVGGLFGGRRASGGPVSAGKAYMVGERGPEPFIPNVGGTILPAGAMKGGGETRIVLEVQEGAAFTTRILEVSGPQSVQIASAGIQSYDQSLPGRSSENDLRFR